MSLKENINEHGFADFIRVHKGIFPDVDLPETEYDLIFLDVTHGLTEINRNVPPALELLSTNGYLCCDDIYKKEEIEALVRISGHTNVYCSGGFYMSTANNQIKIN